MCQEKEYRGCLGIIIYNTTQQETVNAVYAMNDVTHNKLVEE